MDNDDHPSPNSSRWNNPALCPFCSQKLSDGGPGFVDHIQKVKNATCREQFEQWRKNVVNDIGGEWSG